MSGTVDLLVVGDVNPDLLVVGEDLDAASGQVEKLVDSADLLLGGSGAITACQAAKLGISTTFVGVVGDDLLGRFCLDALQACGVDTERCVVDSGSSTGITVVLSKKVDRSMLTFRGAIGALAPSLLPLDLLRTARHVHFAAYYLHPKMWSSLPSIAAGVRKQGGSTSLDPNWDPSESWDSGIARAIESVDFFFANSEEARRIAATMAGIETDWTDDESAQALSRSGTTVVLKKGEAGAMLFAGPVSRTANCPLGEGEAVVDTTGAGDSFDAGFLAGRLSSFDDADSLLVACYCGMRAVKQSGGTAGQPTAAEVLEDLGIRL